jgi:hypothetical protein
MPRKHHVPDDDPDVPLIRLVVGDFVELRVLDGTTREQLVTKLVHAVRFFRCGIKAGKVGKSDKALAQQILLFDVGRALKWAGQHVKRWSKRYDRGDGPDFDAPESFFFRFARQLGDALRIPLPQDLKLSAKRAAQHQYGVMSPAMKRAQDAELAAQR